MKAKELRKLTKAKLVERMDTVRANIIDLSFDIKTGEEKDYSVIKKKKRELARIITMLREKGNETEEQAEVKVTKKEEKKEVKKTKAEPKEEKKVKKEKKETKTKKSKNKK